MLLPSTTDDDLLDGLTPGDLYRYARTCKSAHEAVDSYIRRHFHLHDLLERYFKPDDVLEFRRLQYATGMFISGSTALQFFERVVYPGSDLDLYVEHRHGRTISRWLVSIGYKFALSATYPNETLEEALEVDDDDQGSEGSFYTTTPKGYFGAAAVIDFEKSEPDHRKIQLITAHHSPLQMVLNFHTTGVMNIITHEKAYSLYPKGTFDERRSLLYLPLKNDRRLLVATAKYSARGWKIVPKISADEFDDPKSAFAHGQRHLGDGKCWTLPILPKLDLPASNIEANSWALLYDADLVPNMTSTIFVTDKLRYGYLVADEPLRKYVALISEVLNDKFEGDQELDYIYEKMIEDYRQRSGKRKPTPQSNQPCEDAKT